MRFDAIVTMTSTFVIAVEADNSFEANGKALESIGERAPDKIETHVEIEVGN